MKSSLKEYRRRKNLTQEELSKSSGISIRTIQRIEKGLSMGSSHTLKTLAKTLNIESTDILHDGSSRSFAKNNITTLKLMNFSVLTMLVIPFGNIIFPAIVYFINRDDGKINTIGKKILNFQILSMLVLPFFLVILFLLLGAGHGALTMTFIFSYLTYGFVNIIITIQTSIQINEEKEVLNFVPNIL